MISGVIALPLVFVTADESFALPKTAVMLAITGVLVAGLAAYAARSFRPLQGRPSLIASAFLALALLTLAATLVSRDPVGSLRGEPHQYQGLGATLSYGVAFTAAWVALRRPEAFRVVIVALVATATVVALYGVLQQLGLDPIWRVLNKGRIFSTLGQANNLAAYLVLCLPFAIVLAWHSNGRGRVLFASAALLITVTIALTLSRSGYLGAIAVVIALSVLLPMWATARRELFTGRVGAGLGVAAVLAGTAMLVGGSRLIDPIAARVAVIVDASETSAATRVDLWTVAAHMTVEHPMLGIGPEMYPRVFRDYRDRVLTPERAEIMKRFRPESPHNVVLAVASGSGVPAALAYLLVVGLALAAAWQGVKSTTGTQRAILAAVIAACVGHVVTDSFMTAEVAGSWHFWVVLGVAAAAMTRASSGGPESGSSTVQGAHAPRLSF